MFLTTVARSRVNKWMLILFYCTTSGQLTIPIFTIDNGVMKCERVNTFGEMSIVMIGLGVITNTITGVTVKLEYQYQSNISKTIIIKSY